MTVLETRELDDGGPQEVPEGKMGETKHLEGGTTRAYVLLKILIGLLWPDTNKTRILSVIY